MAEIQYGFEHTKQWVLAAASAPDAKGTSDEPGIASSKVRITLCPLQRVLMNQGPTSIHRSRFILNVTVVNPVAAGFLTVAPQGASEPNASNVNYSTGETTANRVIVPLSASGKVAVWTSATADLVVDVSGYFSPVVGPGGAQLSSNGPPLRVCDTRPAGTATLVNQCTGQTLTSSGVLNVSMSSAGVPSDASAVLVNVTGISPTEPTFLTVYPQGKSVPVSSDLNLAPGDIKANLVVATLSASGQISIYNADGNVDIAVDVLGWYS